jgi:hypothetical protein
MPRLEGMEDQPLQMKLSLIPFAMRYHEDLDQIRSDDTRQRPYDLETIPLAFQQHSEPSLPHQSFHTTAQKPVPQAHTVGSDRPIRIA